MLDPRNLRFPLEILFGVPGVSYGCFESSGLVEAKQLGKSLLKKRRIAGIQMQKMPTYASRTDQYAVGTLSYVGFVELENCTRDWRRTIETTVVLIFVLAALQYSMRTRPDVQCAHTEHQDDQHLLLPAKCESQQLWYRHDDDDYIEGNVETCMCPGEDVEVDACTSVLAVPICPDVGYRCAVEETSERKGDPVRNNNDYEDDNCFSEALSREDSKAEEEKR